MDGWVDGLIIGFERPQIHTLHGGEQSGYYIKSMKNKPGPPTIEQDFRVFFFMSVRITVCNTIMIKVK